MQARQAWLQARTIVQRLADQIADRELRKGFLAGVMKLLPLEDSKGFGES
jgi:hypothetical protein